MAQSKKKVKAAKQPSAKPGETKIPVERAQIGVRIEKRMVKVLKALAEYFDVSLTELLM